jgi:hypothetical protein
MRRLLARIEAALLRWLLRRERARRDREAIEADDWSDPRWRRVL